MSSQFPSCPISLKPIQHYLKTASEHDNRDMVVSYWCRLYSLQLALKMDHSAPDAKALLFNLMNWLEETKKQMSENEAITNEIAAQAHIENYALKLFLYADGQDRAANFGKNVVKAFYTSGVLFDVLTTFGELTEEISQNRKYAKWKAAYIHNCLKNGETPVPGPMADGEEENLFEGESSELPQPAGFVIPSSSNDVEPNVPNTDTEINQENFVQPAPPVTPQISGHSEITQHSEGGVQLNPDQISKAQKYCKWASSALNYDDVPTAVDNLQKALKLLQTGIDS